MAETKEDIAVERDLLREENERLKAENESIRADVARLARQGIATLTGPAAPQQTFQLSEGDRQELAARGATVIGGRLMTRDEVRAELPETQQGIDLGDGPVDPALQVLLDRRPSTTGIPGVTHVYPSVAPGRIDPAVAGTPGISGPAADAKS